jgi:DNA-binding MarR family transcriptional regulator
MDRTLPPELRDEFPDPPARAAVVAIVRAFGTVQRLMTPHYARFGLTPPQFQLLTVANRLRQKPLTQRRLARALYVSFPNITSMLARLEGAGLIERQVNPEDRRQKLVRLTPKARGLLRRIWKQQVRQLEWVTDGLKDRERLEVAALLTKLNSAHAGRTRNAQARPDGRRGHGVLERAEA